VSGQNPMTVKSAIDGTSSSHAYEVGKDRVLKPRILRDAHGRTPRHPILPKKRRTR
jgi:hypothetical protein